LRNKVIISKLQRAYRNKKLIADRAFKLLVTLGKEFDFEFFFPSFIFPLLLLGLLPLDRLLLAELINFGLVLFLQSNN